MFNEVFLTEARVADDDRIGDLNNGWAVANATLGFERSGLGTGGGHASVSIAIPGTVAGDLGKRAGDFVGTDPSGGTSSALQMGSSVDVLIQLAQESGRIADPIVRQDLMRLYTIGEIG